MVSVRSTLILFAASIPAFAAEPTLPNKPALSTEQRADIYMARKMYREAIETYREAPASAVVLNKLGIAYHHLVQMPLARKSYESAIKLDPGYAEAINNLGTVHYAMKDYRNAVKLYKRALRKSPRSAPMYSNLGTAYFARHDYKRAAEAYQTALGLDPEVFEHRGTHGVLLQDQSVTERAKFHYYLARTYARAGMHDRALQYIRKALEEGFDERKKFFEEADFATLRVTDEFKELMLLEPKKL